MKPSNWWHPRNSPTRATSLRPAAIVLRSACSIWDEPKLTEATGRCTKHAEQRKDRTKQELFSHLGDPSAKDNDFVKKSWSFHSRYRCRCRKRDKFFRENGIWTCMNQRKSKSKFVVIVAAIQYVHPEDLSEGGTKRASKSSCLSNTSTWLNTKPFAIIRHKEIGRDQERLHTTPFVLWDERDVYLTTENL